MVAVGLVDKTIRILKCRVKDFKMFVGHQKTVWSVRFISNTLLLSCSSDHAIKVWNIKTGKCIRTIVGHGGAVWCLDVKGEMFATGSADKSAKVWNLRTSQAISCFYNHPGGVYAVRFNEEGNRLFTGSIEKTLKEWDIYNMTCLVSIQIGCNKTSLTPITSFTYNKGYLACVCGTGFQIYETSTRRLLELYKDCHKERIEGIQLKVELSKDISEEIHFKILTCGKDGRIKVWEKGRKKPLLTFIIADEISIYDFIFDDSKIICVTNDGVKKLDFNVNSDSSKLDTDQFRDGSRIKSCYANR